MYFHNIYDIIINMEEKEHIPLSNDDRLRMLSDALTEALIELRKRDEGGGDMDTHDIFEKITDQNDTRLLALLRASFTKQVEKEEDGYAGFQNEIAEFIERIDPEYAINIRRRYYEAEIQRILRGQGMDARFSEPDKEAENVVQLLIDEGLWPADEIIERYEALREPILGPSVPRIGTKKKGSVNARKKDRS